MLFFRDYLRQHDQPADNRFEENDEAAFVFELLLIRLGLFRPPLNRWYPLPEAAPRSPEARRALRFVASFLCFFIPKPPAYREEIDRLKSAFIPGFYESDQKQELLAKTVRPSFSEAPYKQVQSWEKTASPDEYFALPHDDWPHRRGGER